MPKQKKQSKLIRTLGWFKPTSAKKGALLFAIAFAVVGGSVFAYKSFAATVAVSAANIKISDYNASYVTHETEYSSDSKSSSEVIRINTYDGFVNSIHVPIGWVTGSAHKQACVKAKSPWGPSHLTVSFGFDGTPYPQGSKTYSLSKSDTYATYCSDSSSLTAGYLTIHVYGGVNNTSDNGFYVSQVSLRQ